MGDSGSKPQSKSDKGDRPLKEPRNNVAPNHIVKILVQSSAQPLHDGHEKREKYVRLEKAPPPKSFRCSLIEETPLPGLDPAASEGGVDTNALNVSCHVEKLKTKTSAYITKFVVCSPNLQLSSVHPIKDEPSALKLPKSTPADGRDARMVQGD
uniref:Uncharacterized protein n=1 Tax=Oryza glumipatula TaxID=40148 RepID=A0A0D9YPH3_9ORYZ